MPISNVYLVTAEGVERAARFGINVKQGQPLDGQLINELRNAGVNWDREATRDGIKYLVGIRSAIPLRKIWHADRAEPNARGDPIRTGR